MALATEEDKMPRIDQDINFLVNGLPCFMRLETATIGKEDLWIILPKDNNSPVFKTKIDVLLEKSDIIYDDECDYFDYCVHDDFATLKVDQDGFSLSEGIMLSLPQWDGESLDFIGSGHLIRLLRAFKKASPGIEFARTDGRVIEI